MIASHCYPNKNPSISSPPKRPMDFFFFCQRGKFFFFRKEVLEVCIGMDLMSIFQSFSASVMCDTDLFSNYQVGCAFTTWRAFNKRLLASQPSLLQPPFFWRSLQGKLPRGVSRVGCCTGIDDCDVVKFFLLRLLFTFFWWNSMHFFCSLFMLNHPTWIFASVDIFSHEMNPFPSIYNLLFTSILVCWS